MGQEKPKQFLPIAHQPLLAHCLATFCRVRFISRILVVVPVDHLEEAARTVFDVCSQQSRAVFEDARPIESRHQEPAGSVRSGPVEEDPVTVAIVEGGNERQDSVFNALQELPEDSEWVVVHDGVRPLVSLELIEETWKAALRCGAAIAAVPATDTVKQVQDGLVTGTLPRHQVWLVQTPQVFRKDLLLRAYQVGREQGVQATDDASLVEALGHPVAVVPGERANIKVTRPEDLAWLDWFCQQTQCTRQREGESR
jgi:2-C-methyl-D-erythritol 4-phosphate cytidylyltransferase